jgi:putative peptide maturation dehydrogenase
VRVRRPRFLCFFLDDYPFLDIDQLLRGTVEPVTVRQVYALSILRGESVALDAGEFELVTTTPSAHWVDAENDEQARKLGRSGVLLCDSDEPELAELRERHDRLEQLGWHLEAALYYFLTKWHGVDLRTLAGQDETADLLPPTDEAVREFVERYGPAPAAFHSLAAPISVHPLPSVEGSGDMYETLARRRTTRSFDRATPLPLEQFALVLDTVFGFRGYVPLFGEVTTLKRTSPSAGGFHPVDAYPLLTHVENLQPGLYHYDAHARALELIELLARDDAHALASSFLCGQTYFGDAHAVVLLAARFERAFWKYRNHAKALTALLMDAAHLSQTLYLVATDLELGAFVTAAINNRDIENRLGLDGVGEGVLAACGVGVPADRPSLFDPRFIPIESAHSGHEPA